MTGTRFQKRVIVARLKGFDVAWVQYAKLGILVRIVVVHVGNNTVFHSTSNLGIIVVLVHRRGTHNETTSKSGWHRTFDSGGR